ncbi:TetR/AcrR family transcriptional regulator [Nocardia sp. NPDC005366]|uniref:TetR/AcrR family transcriptional regulator n=1 Tax=Nocardia sp. NPDC005366 TaxID=3156878 RepID=UPI0033AE2B17
MSERRSPGDDRNAERRRIIDSAYRLLADNHGISLPITAVLDASGISTRAFYRHFETKDALMLAMLRDDSDAVRQMLVEEAAAAVDARTALRGWTRYMLALAADPRRRSRALVLTSDEIRRARGYADERQRYTAGQDIELLRLLRRGVDDGSLPGAHPESDAPLIRAVIEEGFAKIMSAPSELDSAKMTDEVWSFIDRSTR